MVNKNNIHGTFGKHRPGLDWVTRFTQKLLKAATANKQPNSRARPQNTLAAPTGRLGIIIEECPLPRG